MKKFILIMVLGSALFTGGAIYDGIDNQDMTQPTIHFWEKNPMKLNLYAKGQCTYYVFDRIRQDGNMISNRWEMPNIGLMKQAKKDIKLMIIQVLVQFFNIQKVNMVMLHM